MWPDEDLNKIILHGTRILPRVFERMSEWGNPELDCAIHRRQHAEWKQAHSRALVSQSPGVCKGLIWRRGWDCTRHIHVPRPTGSLKAVRNCYPCNFVEPTNVRGFC